MVDRSADRRHRRIYLTILCIAFDRAYLPLFRHLAAYPNLSVFAIYFQKARSHVMEKGHGYYECAWVQLAYLCAWDGAPSFQVEVLCSYVFMFTVSAI